MAPAKAKPLPRRPLGKQGMQAPAQIVGCLGLEDAGAAALIKAAKTVATAFFDTADVYGPHRNEEMLAKVLKGKGDKFQVATKFGFVPGPSGALSLDGSPAHARKACDASLQRLKVKCIDLYYLHR